MKARQEGEGVITYSCLLFVIIFPFTPLSEVCVKKTKKEESLHNSQEDVGTASHSLCHATYLKRTFQSDVQNRDLGKLAKRLLGLLLSLLACVVFVRLFEQVYRKYIFVH